MSELNIEHILNEVERERRRLFIYEEIYKQCTHFGSTGLTRFLVSKAIEWGLDPNEINYHDWDSVDFFNEGVSKSDLAKEGFTSFLMGKFLEVEQIPDIRIAENSVLERGPTDPLHRYYDLPVSKIVKGNKALTELLGTKQEISFDDSVRLIDRLIATRPDAALELYKMAWNSIDSWVGIRYDDLGSRDTQEKKSMRAILSKSLPALSKAIPKDSSALVEEALDFTEHAITRSNGVQTLLDLAGYNPTLAIQVYKNIEVAPSSTPHAIFVDISSELRLNFLMKVYRTVLDDLLVPAEDSEYQFINGYLNSRCVNVEGDKTKPLREAKDVLEELVNFVQQGHKEMRESDFREDLNYNRLQKVLDAGEAKSLDEIIECASIETPDFIALKRLGSGARGTSYLMQNIGASEKLSVFKINETKESTELEVQVQNVKNLKHKNIAEMYGITTVKINGEAKQAINMEYVEGRTLREVLNDDKLDLHTAVDYTLQILEGLSYLEAYDIRHLDLNPANIMITDDGVVKIIDFGMASSKDKGSQEKLNRRYGAPELRIGQEAPNSDLWSVGLIFYEMLEGKPLLYDSKDEEKNRQSVANMLKDKIQNGQELDEEVIHKFELEPQDESNVVRMAMKGCLAVDPEKRIKTAKEAQKRLLSQYVTTIHLEQDSDWTSFSDDVRLIRSLLESYGTNQRRVMQYLLKNMDDV